MLDGAGRELLDAGEPHHTLDSDGAVRPDGTPVLRLGEGGEGRVARQHEGGRLVAVLFEDGADEDVDERVHIFFYLGVFLGG